MHCNDGVHILDALAIILGCFWIISGRFVINQETAVKKGEGMQGYIKNEAHGENLAGK